MTAAWLRLAGTEARMVTVLDELGLAGLAASIDGMSALPGTVILAETGDPRRFASGRAVDWHAGLNPSEHKSATIDGQTRISRRRPFLGTSVLLILARNSQGGEHDRR